jgi:hypothetical protein
MAEKSSLKPLISKNFEGNKMGQEVFAGQERHSSAWYDNRGYPL